MCKLGCRFHRWLVPSEVLHRNLGIHRRHSSGQWHHLCSFGNCNDGHRPALARAAASVMMRNRLDDRPSARFNEARASSGYPRSNITSAWHCGKASRARQYYRPLWWMVCIHHHGSSAPFSSTHQLGSDLPLPMATSLRQLKRACGTVRRRSPQAGCRVHPAGRVRSMTSPIVQGIMRILLLVIHHGEGLLGAAADLFPQCHT